MGVCIDEDLSVIRMVITEKRKFVERYQEQPSNITTDSVEADCEASGLRRSGQPLLAFYYVLQVIDRISVYSKPQFTRITSVGTSVGRSSAVGFSLAKHYY